MAPGVARDTPAKQKLISSRDVSSCVCVLRAMQLRSGFVWLLSVLVVSGGGGSGRRCHTLED